jgi:acyl-ACP thioesterase
VLDVLQAYQEKEDSKKLKQKQRERMQPKMGKLDIDYQVRKHQIPSSAHVQASVYLGSHSIHLSSLT